MPLIELNDYTLAEAENGMRLEGINFTLSAGDVCAIKSDASPKAALFIKGLATLVRPVSGSFRFDGQTVDFSDYRRLLPVKKRIGYLAYETRLISNRTLLENLLFMRYYYENSLALTLDEKSLEFCRLFGIQEKLHLRPGKVPSPERHYAAIVREFGKGSDLLLVDRPEDFIGPERFQIFLDILKNEVVPKQAVVFFSNDRYLLETLANRSVLISGSG